MSPARPRVSTRPIACRERRLALSVRAALLGLALVTAPLAQATGAAALDAAAARSYNIPAGPLGRSLSSFAVNAGLALSFEPALTEGLQSPALSGSYAPREAINRLLAGSGLELVARSDGSYTLRKAAAPVPAPRDPVATEAGGSAEAGRRIFAAGSLPVVRVKAGPLDEFGGVRHTDEKVLKWFPAVNGDITSVLKLNPQVQFDNAKQSAMTQGEIAPADVSINGAKFYQNLFLLDGISINNDLDPGFKNPAHYADIPGASQGLPVDKDLICDLEVHDSNVSARYGEFQGGVIKAEICEARKAFSGRVSYSVSRSEWSTIFVDPTQAEDLANSYSDDKQPKWLKETWRTSLQARPSKTLGITAYLTQTRSAIPLKGFVAAQTPGDPELLYKEQTRRKTDGLVKFDWRPEAHTHAWMTLRREPLRDRYFNQNGRDTEFDIWGGGETVNSGLEHRLLGQRVRHDLSYSMMQNSRRGEVPYIRNWWWSAEKNWGDASRGANAASLEGAWGDVDTEQKTVAYALTVNPIEAGEWLGGRNSWSWGLNLKQREAKYERLHDHMSYVSSSKAVTNNCTDARGVVDTEGCSLSPLLRDPRYGQYFRTRDVYQAGGFALDVAQAALWLEDQAEWSRLSLRAGLRAERDELASRATFSPRLSGAWKIDEAGAGRLNFGLNRYYGRSFFNAALREKRETLKLTQNRGINLLWDTGVRALPLNRLDELRVPYDDEQMLGASLQQQSWRVGVKWVHRESRDQLTRMRPRDSSGNYAGTGPYVYTNNGRGSSDTLSLELDGSKPWLWARGRHNWTVALSRTQSRSNHEDYETVLSVDGIDPWIKYEGQFMRLSDKPATNYNRPWTARASLASEWPAANLSLYQFARWQAGYRKIASTGVSEVFEGGVATVYGMTDFAPTFSWDLSLTWQPRIGRHRPSVTLSIENLTNRRNIVNGVGDVMTYEKGRSAYLQAGYEF